MSDPLEELDRLGGEASTVITIDPADVPDEFEPGDVWRRLPSDRPVLELGERVNAPKVCTHPASDVMVETLVATIEPGEGEQPRWEIRLKAICQCGIDFAVAREGRAPRDGSPGTVLALTPLSCDTSDQSD